MEADIVPYDNIIGSCVLFMWAAGISMLSWLSKKCDNVVCVVWAEGDTAVEDICDGCTHRNIPATLARIIDDGSVTDDVPSPSAGGGIQPRP